MALVLADRVKETSTTTGTGTVTLAGAVSGYQTFAVVGNSNTTYYAIVGRTTTEWEVGIGTYTSSGTTLSRDTVLASSNSNSLVNFSAGTKDVFVTYPAGKSVNYDASGNLGIGVTPSAWSGINSTLQLAGSSVVAGSNQYLDFTTNAYYNSGYKYIGTGLAALYGQAAGQHQWYTAASGTAGNAISFTQAMTLNASGNLSIGSSTAYERLNVWGNGTIVNDSFKGVGASSSLTFRSGGNTAELAVPVAAISGIDQYNAAGATGYSGSLIFQYQSANALVEGMRLNYLGNLGIGTSSPEALLTVSKTTEGGEGGYIWIDNPASAAGGANKAGIKFGTSSGASFTTVPTGEITNLQTNTGNGAAALTFGTFNGTASGERMRLDAVGNLGIGVTPSTAWGGVGVAMQIGSFLSLNSNSNLGSGDLATNSIRTASDSYQYLTTNAATRLHQRDGDFKFYTAPSGTAGTAISWTQAMLLDAAGNLGIGVTPSAWVSYQRGIDFGGAGNYGSLSARADFVVLGNNAYLDSSGTTWRYKNTAPASYLSQSGGAFVWNIAASGTAGNAISFTQAMTLSSAGSVTINATASPALSLNGVAQSQILNSPTGTYTTWQYNGTSVGDIGSGNQTFSGGGTGDFGITSRAGNLVLGTNSTEKMRIASNGDVTASVNSAFNVNGTSSGALVYANANAGTYRGVEFRTAGSRRWLIAAEPSSETGSNAGSNFDIYRYTDGGIYIDTVLSINRATGSVAISTSSSGASLTVNGTTDLYNGATNSAQLKFGNSGGTGYLHANGGAIHFLSGSTGWPIVFGYGTATITTEVARFDGSGNFGIGTSSPSTMLTVVGTTAKQAILKLQAASGSTGGFKRTLINLRDDTGTAGYDIVGLGDGSNALTFESVSSSVATERMKIASAGNVTINAPASGTALTVNAVSGTHSTKIADSAGTLYEAGYLGVPQNSQTSGYTLVLADRGKHISITTGGVTVNASIFSAGDAVSIYNNSTSSQTITQGSNVTLRLAGTATTGSRTLTQYGVATLLCVTGGANPVFACSGAGLT